MAMASIRPVNTACSRADNRSCADHDVPVRHHGCDAWEGAGRLRADCDRPRLTLIHLISIPVTNTSVNPARSTATAIFVGGWAIQQLWLFWLAPVVGAALAGATYKALLEGPVEEPPVTGRSRS